MSIRTDHGREFDNEAQFGEFCNANGITHNFSAPRTPQSNGVVERKNRTLQEMSRTMLNEQSLPQKFWCNAIDTSTYILNRILIRAILGKTPYELLREPKNVNEALGDESWIVAMQEELNQFVANEVWELVPQPRNRTIIGTKWVFRNKLDVNGMFLGNKAIVKRTERTNGPLMGVLGLCEMNWKGGYRGNGLLGKGMGELGSTLGGGIARKTWGSGGLGFGGKWCWYSYGCLFRDTSFKPADLVYHNNDASHAEDKGKLGPKLEGSYKVMEALGKRAYKLRDRKGNILPQTWNICNLMKCYVHEM
ncbi:retrovirus-related pol polyprotein from transposon TNT 1-94 [Tanacetum coccineum]